MRLDKFVGKASIEQKIRVFDWGSSKELFYLPDGDCFEEYKEAMKHYKVMYFEARNSLLVIEAKKKED
jgi:hypothetical protein